MFCDDVLGVCVDIGHKKTAVGYIGDDMPRYSTASLSGTLIKDGSMMDVEYEEGMKRKAEPQIFGESLTCKYQGVQYNPILEKEKSRRAS